MEGGEEYLHYKLEGVPSVSYLFRGAGQNGRHADHGRITRVEIDVGGREEERARAFLKTFLSPLSFPRLLPSLWIIAISNVLSFEFFSSRISESRNKRGFISCPPDFLRREREEGWFLFFFLFF